MQGEFQETMQKTTTERRRMNAGSNVLKALVEIEATTNGIGLDARKARLDVRAHDAVRELRMKLNPPSMVTDPKRLNLRTRIVSQEHAASRKEGDRIAVDGVKDQTLSLAKRAEKRISSPLLGQSDVHGSDLITARVLFDPPPESIGKDLVPVANAENRCPELVDIPQPGRERVRPWFGSCHGVRGAGHDHGIDRAFRQKLASMRLSHSDLNVRAAGIQKELTLEHGIEVTKFVLDVVGGVAGLEKTDSQDLHQAIPHRQSGRRQDA